MNPGICNEELQDCTITGLSDSMLWRKLLRRTGNCFSLAVSAVVTGTFSPSSTQRTQTRTLNSTIAASSVAAGARSVTIETSEDFTGTILGVIAQPSRIYEFEAKQNDDTLGTIAYVITAGSVIIGKSV